jgi:membrane-associated phospholipid phosphatase
MKKGILILSSIIFSLAGFSQRADTLIRKLDSLSKKTNSAGGQENVIDKTAYNKATVINGSSYFILLECDLKQAFTKPFHMKGDLGKLGKFVLVFGALSFADEPIQRTALRFRQHNKVVRNISGQITKFGGTYETYTLGVLGAYGFLFKNRKIQTTTLLATQSYLTGTVIESALKLLAGRQRPYITDSTKVEVEPTFYGPFYKTPRDPNSRKTNSSFPSGHTTVAFAAATVFALEYKNKPWVPVLAYSAASLIGLSRIIENRHWTTDVLTGAAVGYLSGRLVVNNYHRYARIRDPNEKRSSVSFDVQYNFGHLTPGFIYTFR